MNFIQLRRGVGAWRSDGVFTAGHVLGTTEEEFDFGTDDGVLRLFHHEAGAVGAAVAEFGTEAVLLTSGVFVVLGAQQDIVFSGAATFSVATEEQRVECRTGLRSAPRD